MLAVARTLMTFKAESGSLNILKCLATVCLIVGGSVATVTPAPFENLGLDTPSVFDDFGVEKAENVLPGWGLYHGNVPQPDVGFNDTRIFSDDLTNVVLVDQNHASWFGPVQGTYALNVVTTTDDSFSLSQRGDVPEENPFLRLQKTGYWQLSINGDPVAPVLDSDMRFPPSPFASIQIFDLTPFSGQNVEMRLTSPSTVFGAGSYWLADIQFVAELPEPKTAVLWAVTVLLVIVVRGRRHLLCTTR
jgi:hypothetical protein